MTMVRASAILAGLSRTAPPRFAMGATNALQVYSAGAMHWSKKSVILRNPPYTIDDPHDGQKDVRIRFGEIARSYKGSRGFENGLPIVAARIQGEMRGYRSPYALSPEQWPSAQRHTVHTVDELRAMLERQLAQSGGVPIR